MTDNIISLNNKTSPVSIKYAKSYHGFSDSNNNNNKYLFELIINGQVIGKKYFRTLEENKYSHLITTDHKIKLKDIDTYKVTVSILSSYNNDNYYNLEGIINQDVSCSTHRNDDLYIEFTKTDSNYTLCSCFYTGLEHNKIFASPPN
jgi:hypothetical protein